MPWVYVSLITHSLKPDAFVCVCKVLRSTGEEEDGSTIRDQPHPWFRGKCKETLEYKYLFMFLIYLTVSLLIN